MRSVVLVGGGIASCAAAATLRKEGYDGSITLVTDEGHAPYERPPLSKEFLAGSSAADELAMYPPDWFEEQQVSLLLEQRVDRVDPSERAVELAEGRRLPADAVLLATGGRPRWLPGGDGLDGVCYLRTIEDAERIRDALDPGGHLVVIGAGFLGLEVASVARGHGMEVTVVEREAVPLAPAIGSDMGQLCAALHRERGTRLLTGATISSIEAARGSVLVRLNSGTLEASLVVVAIGMVPNTEVAVASGLSTQDGVVVDTYCRTSSAQVYAAGDVAARRDAGGRVVRVEHYDNALRQAEAAARNMLGGGEPYDGASWFWSDQYDRRLQFAGTLAPHADAVSRGSADAFDLLTFFVHDGRIEGVVALGRTREFRQARNLVGKDAPDLALLADESVNLRGLGT